MELELKKASRYSFYKEQKKEVLKSIEKLNSKRKNLIDVYTDMDSFPRDELKEKLSEIESTKLEFEEEIRDIDSMLLTQDLKKDKVKSVKEMFKKYKKNLERLTYEDRMEVIKRIVKRITIK